MKLQLTNKTPNKEGYYWYCNFGEHTPTVVRVTKDKHGFYAQNKEFCFVISEPVAGEEVWCYIPNPTLDGKEILPDSF